MDDATSGVVVSHDGDVTRLVWSCERPTMQRVPLPPLDAEVATIKSDSSGADRPAAIRISAATTRPAEYTYEIHRAHYEKMRALYKLCVFY